jgi:ubiquitin carboxyl-terminal hydrolase 5/13
VDLSSFLAFGRDYVLWNFEKTGDPVYLHIKRTRRPGPEEEQPRKKPTVVAIGKDPGR